MTIYYVVVGFNNESSDGFIPYSNKGVVTGHAITFDEEEAKRWATAWGKTYKRKYIMVSVDESEL